MDLKKLFGTDAKKEAEGVWANIGPGVDIKVKRAGASNKEYSFEQSKMLKPLQRQLQLGTVDPQVFRNINAKLFAKHIVTDWRGVTEDGKAVKFSKEKFHEYATKYPEFLLAVMDAATDIQNFQEAEDDELVKKQQSSTATD